MNYEVWFPTPIWSTNVDNTEELNKLLLEIIYNLKKNDSAGMQRSNYGGWHSKETLHTDPSFTSFLNILNEAGKLISKDLDVMDEFKLQVVECWANINSSDNYNRSHSHPGAVFSGAYYVKVPKNSGKIFFEDPRVQLDSAVRHPVSKHSMLTTPLISYPAKEGDLLIFPGWLKHHVDQNRSDDDRVSISFNFVYETA